MCFQSVAILVFTRKFSGRKKPELLREIDCETLSVRVHCLDLQVEDTLGNGMILDLLKEVDGNGDGVIDFQATKLQCVCRCRP